MGGKVGGPARARILSAERRIEIARIGAEARWGKTRKRGDKAPKAEEAAA